MEQLIHSTARLARTYANPESSHQTQQFSKVLPFPFCLFSSHCLSIHAEVPWRSCLGCLFCAYTTILSHELRSVGYYLTSPPSTRITSATHKKKCGIISTPAKKLVYSMIFIGVPCRIVDSYPLPITIQMACCCFFRVRPVIEG